MTYLRTAILIIRCFLYSATPSRGCGGGNERPACCSLAATPPGDFSGASVVGTPVAAGNGVRMRTRRPLSRQEREEISRGLARGESGAAIGRRLGREASVINREVGANGGPRHYRAEAAQGRSERLRHRTRGNKIADSTGLQAAVIEMLERRTPPREIARRLRRQHPDDPTMNASHETIYDFLFCHAKPRVASILRSYLKHPKNKRGLRRRKAGAGPGRTAGAVLISARPEEVAGRRVPGHWEVDLLMGAGNQSALLVLIERTSRYLMLIRIPSHDAETVHRAIVRAVRHLPEQMRRTLTCDNGPEMAKHLAITMKTGMQVYFCDPHSPWQKGAIEQVNGLIRDYFPKGTNFHTVKPSAVRHAEWCLNNRPRSVLDAQTPAEVFYNLINQDCAIAA